MNTKYDSQWLIQVASVANELSRYCNMSASGAIQRLALAVEEKELCSDLYLPVQKMWHGGQPESIETPVKEGAEQWRSIVKQSKAHHQSDKQKFDLPTSVSKYHVLASDLFEYSKRCSISSRAKDALRDLALRFNPELAAVSTATDGDAPAAKAGHGAQEQATAPRAAQAALASEMKPEVATAAVQVAPVGGDQNVIGRRRWTPEFTADVQEYRDEYGPTKTAKHYGVNISLISRKTKPKSKEEKISTWVKGLVLRSNQQ